MQGSCFASAPLHVTFGRHLKTTLSSDSYTISVAFTDQFEQTDLVRRAEKAQETLGDGHLTWTLTDATRKHDLVFKLSQPLWNYLATLPKRGVETGFHRLLSIRKNKTQTQKQLDDYLQPSHTASTLLKTIHAQLDKQA